MCSALLSGLLPIAFGVAFIYTVGPMVAANNGILLLGIPSSLDWVFVLPLVNALNGGNPTNLVFFTSTNNFVGTGPQTTTTPATRTPVPTPTGRKSICLNRPDWFD